MRMRFKQLSPGKRKAWHSGVRVARDSCSPTDDFRDRQAGKRLKEASRRQESWGLGYSERFSPRRRASQQPQAQPTLLVLEVTEERQPLDISN